MFIGILRGEVLMSYKPTTSAQINDATQTRYVPGKKPDLPDERPPVYAALLIPFILLLIKLCDIYDWIRSKKIK